MDGSNQESTMLRNSISPRTALWVSAFGSLLAISACGGAGSGGTHLSGNAGSGVTGVAGQTGAGGNVNPTGAGGDATTGTGGMAMTGTAGAGGTMGAGVAQCTGYCTAI